MPKTEAAMQRVARKLARIKAQNLVTAFEYELTREFGEVLTKADALTEGILAHKPEVGCLECKRRASELRVELEKVMRSE